MQLRTKGLKNYHNLLCYMYVHYKCSILNIQYIDNKPKIQNLLLDFVVQKILLLLNFGQPLG